MIEFKRYPHIDSLLRHYAEKLGNSEAIKILDSGVSDTGSAELLSKFVWQVVDAMHEDEENKIEVLGSTNNIEMIPDLEYEISNYMRSSGFFSVWQKVSENA